MGSGKWRGTGVPTPAQGIWNILKQRRNGEVRYLLRGPKGLALPIFTDDLFDLAELLDDVCDKIEDEEANGS
jgi:hypothetical protein